MKAFSRDIAPARNNRSKSAPIVTIPSPPLDAITLSIWCTFDSRIIFQMALLASIISNAGANLLSVVEIRR